MDTTYFYKKTSRKKGVTAAAFTCPSTKQEPE
jgi:hypothetical protein